MQPASRGHRVRGLRVLVVVAAVLALFAIPLIAQAASFDVGLDVTVPGSPGGGGSEGPDLAATGFSTIQWFGLGLVTLVGGAWAVAYGSRPFRALQKGGAR
ncbi:MAG: hypothetical protein ACRDHK_13640 [Actinomycetota bacterium]